MLRSTGGQREYPNSRRYSTNNPFRMSMIDTGGISPSSEQPQQDWFRPSSPSIEESHEMQYVHAPYHSAGSSRVNSPLGGGFRKSVSPSTNPFLDDVEHENNLNRGSRNSSQNDYSPPQYPRTSPRTTSYPTASEEKQRLRNRYNEIENTENHEYGDVDADLPPSYDEVAGPKRTNAPYPREKTSASSSTAPTPPPPRDPLIGSNRETERRRRYSNYGSSSVATPPLSRGPSGGPPPAQPLSESRHRYDRERVPRDRYRERDHSDREYYSDREYRDRERSRQHRHHHRHHSRQNRDHEGGSSSKDKKRQNGSKPQQKGVDSIDKMDVTALFGGSFHHDGPFDAVTPHRNKNAKAPPVLAFPANGPNNSIGGAPTKKNAMNEVFGRVDLEEEDDIYHAPPRIASNPRTTVFGASSDPPSSNGSTTTLDAIKPGSKSLTAFDPRGRIKTVEGPTTDGLGSTTFLDGAPASNKAIEEDVRTHARQTRLGGVQRKKSFSQRITGKGGNAPGSGNSYGHLTPNGGYSRGPASEEPLSLTRSHSGHLENGGDDEDVYLGLPSSDLSRKQSTGTKLMRRVRSMKVGRK